MLFLLLCFWESDFRMTQIFLFWKAIHASNMIPAAGRDTNMSSSQLGSVGGAETDCFFIKISRNYKIHFVS